MRIWSNKEGIKKIVYVISYVMQLTNKRSNKTLDVKDMYLLKLAEKHRRASHHVSLTHSCVFYGFEACHWLLYNDGIVF